MTDTTMNTGAASLLPCPFCGGQAEMTFNAFYQNNSIATCKVCGASAFWKKWNERTPQADATIAAGGAQETAAARDVLAERQRQVNAEGWTAEHDDEHDSEEMAIAAACYAESAAGFHHPATGVPHTWPWTNRWWKPTTPRRDLVKAGALILAEIERLDRATASNGEQA